jgi:iron only hydrogenase large subunit-like protein
MNDYEKLAVILEEAALEDRLADEVRKLRESGKYAVELIDTLLRPDKSPLIVQIKKSGRIPDISCLFDAVRRDENGNLVITSECTGCGGCIDASNGALAGRNDVLPLIETLQKREVPVYAMIAPAFSGQFGPEITSGKLRSAFKKLGFYGMIEVALFADILTLKEALEFDRTIQSDKDFLLTSCCCPTWVAIIRKFYAQLVSHVPPSVSPMVACGRSIKKIHPDAKTVFIGPCLAKKAEAKDKDIADAVDTVLTFKEIKELFDIAGIDIASLPEDDSDHSSKAGRIYARTGGVSEAVASTLARLNPEKNIPLTAAQGDGVLECKQLLSDLTEGKIKANFIEGMGCKGGCVGGPRALIAKEPGKENVDRYGDAAPFTTPVDNVHVLELLRSLGFESIESLLERDSTFTRTF